MHTKETVHWPQDVVAIMQFLPPEFIQLHPTHLYYTK